MASIHVVRLEIHTPYRTNQDGNALYRICRKQPSNEITLSSEVPKTFSKLKSLVHQMFDVAAQAGTQKKLALWRAIIRHGSHCAEYLWHQTNYSARLVASQRTLLCLRGAAVK